MIASISSSSSRNRQTLKRNLFSANKTSRCLAVNVTDQQRVELWPLKAGKVYQYHHLRTEYARILHGIILNLYFAFITLHLYIYIYFIECDIRPVARCPSRNELVWMVDEMELYNNK